MQKPLNVPRVVSALSKVDQAIASQEEKIQAIKQRIQKLKNSKGDTLLSAIGDFPPLLALDELYWSTDIKPGILIRLAGEDVHHGHLPKYIKSRAVALCEMCNLPLYATRKDEIKALRLCRECEEEQRSEWKRESEGRKRAKQERLAELQAMPYREYLQTSHWISTRKTELRRAGYKCEVCDAKKQLNVHHKNYNRRGRELPSDLVVLCKDCHGKFHDKVNS